MRLTRWVLTAGLVLAPGLAVVPGGCATTRAGGPPPRATLAPPRLAASVPPPADGAEDPHDPCADPDALDGLDDPCWVDVPPEEVARAVAYGMRKRFGGQIGRAHE